MSHADDPTRPLRDALEVSPDNLPLRRHLADTLAGLERHEEAEVEFRKVLAQSPEDDDLRMALAESYQAQGKTSHADLLVELVTKRDEGSADILSRAFVLQARIKLSERDFKGARSAFRQACEKNPSLNDSEIAEELGLSANNPFDVDDVPTPEALDPFGAGLAGLGGSGFDASDIDGADGPGGRERLASGGRRDDDDEGVLGDVDFERPKIAFSDVGGMEEVKEEISMKVIQPLAHPELFAAYGKKVGGGVLMYGPPGCGKTHLARATAGEAKASFMSVGIHEVLELWIGSSERNLHRIFDEARRRAPCVLFFDEVDALGAKRSDAASTAGRQIINQFLSELDGVEDSNEGLLVLAATNAPWHLDSAFRRPGRFDRLVFVPPPDVTARVAILEVLLRDRPTDPMDLTKVAKKTKEFSGADLKGLVELTIEEKLREALKSGAPTPITEKDLLKAAKRVTATTGEWFSTAKNHVLFANETGHYDDVARYLGLKGSRGES